MHDLILLVNDNQVDFKVILVHVYLARLNNRSKTLQNFCVWLRCGGVLWPSQHCKKVMFSPSVYLLTLFPGRLGPLSG